MSIATLEEARLQLGFDATENAFYQFKLDVATSMIESELGFIVEQQTITEFKDGGFSSFILINRPVISVTSIRDLADPLNPITIDSDDFTVYPEEATILFGDGKVFSHSCSHVALCKCGSRWGYGARRWEIIYTAGYASADIPFDLREATILLVGALANQNDGGVFQSETIGDYSYTLADTVLSGSLPPLVRSILKKYKEISF